MRAVTSRAYGPPEVLRIEEVPAPVPSARDVRVRVQASTVTSGDARIRGFRGPRIFWLPLRLALGLRRPRNPIMGMEFAGVVESVGGAVTRFRVGDAVFGMTMRGANAELVTIREDAAIAAKPANLTNEEAASLPFGAIAALVFLRDVAKLQSGERVLVIGAAGGVGVFAVQLARHFGAHVTAVCSAGSIDLVRSLGAAAVVDRAAEDFTEATHRYDVILDTIGVSDVARCRRVLTPQGRHVFLSFGLAEMLHMAWTALRPGSRVLCGFSGTTLADLRIVGDLAEAGTLRPVIGRRFPLEEAVAAHRHVETGRKRGSLVLTLNDSQGTRTVLFDHTTASSSMNRVDDTSDACARSPARAPVTVPSISDVAPAPGWADPRRR